MLKKLKASLLDVLDFQSRVWVVNVFAGEHRGEPYVVNEDSFAEPMQWMKRKGYSQTMIEKIEKMQRSQVMEFELGTVKHRLLRVK
ncbi:hypothetical protein [Vibrio sinaloensis]|uniref:hypothetical protein n=1 Tax=Photobacterium sp. (strain ATCC 43367) TaxID=379097 RepID=UPI00206BE062|nr:hypothetical protein [Vibrio sinaloensis]UPQ89321.1 hypothetical protein MTO69_16265 [Vibrio sinaloensis]